MRLRYYQDTAIDKIFEYWMDGGGNPLVEMATGTGKSLVIAELVRRIISEFPTYRILCLVHVRELVAQNAKTLLRAWPQAPIGINSASLGRRDKRSQILFASIQSVYNSYPTLGPRDLVIVDEAHLVPAKGEGMYLRMFDDLRKAVPDMRIAGFTATGYRLGTGRIDKGPNRIFDDTVFTYDVAQGVSDGFLTPLVSPGDLETQIDVAGVGKSGGDFKEGALQDAADKDAITQAAVTELCERGINRRSWIVFCTGVQHAHHVKDAIAARGISCGVITGETSTGERDGLIAAFREGRIRCLTNANVLTTGFDAPNVDLIAMLRPTLSTGLYVQILGRGTRCVGADISESTTNGKPNCLVLDFAGNVRRHGPVDAIKVRGGKHRLIEDDGSVKPDSVRAKVCPNCKSYAALNTYVCVVCEHEWPKPPDAPRHDPKADAENLVMTNGKAVDPWQRVISMSYRDHTKRFGGDAPSTLRVDYLVGFKTFSEFLGFDHDRTNFARVRAEKWWREMHGQDPIPSSVAEALHRAQNAELAQPSHIVTKERGNYFDVIGRRFTDEEIARATGTEVSEPAPLPAPKPEADWGDIAF